MLQGYKVIQDKVTMNPKIVDWYKLLITTTEITMPDAGYFSKRHLLWMLDEIKNNPDQSEIKKHRWLGQIQGVLAVYGVIDIDDERDMTRSLFNGM